MGNRAVVKPAVGYCRIGAESPGLVFLAGEYQASERAALFLGAGAQIARFSFDGGSQSDADPVAFGGVTLTLQKSPWWAASR